MNIRKLFFCFLIFTFSLSAFPAYFTYASTEVQDEKNASIFFLLDASGSMKTNDPSRLAIDSIAQLIYSVPSNYHVGFAAYNTEVIAGQMVSDNDSRSRIMKDAEQVIYKDYTNAGAGLEQAVTFLQNDESTDEKTIVILSDGEIVMGTDEKTAESLALFQSSLKEAKQMGVTIHVIGLGKEMEDSGNTIFAAASETGGRSYHAPLAADIQDAVDDILVNRLKIRQNTAGVVDGNDSVEELIVKLPAKNADKVRLLLRSGEEITNLKTDFNAEKAKQINGVRYSLLEITNPVSDRVALSFFAKSGSQVKVDFIIEYHAVPRAAVHYSDKVPADISAKNYERTAAVEIAFYHPENEKLQLFADDLFEYGKVPLKINGKEFMSTLSEGTLTFDYPVTESCKLEVEIDFSHLQANILSGAFLEIEMEGAPLLPPPPPPPAKPDYRPIYAGITIAVLLIAAMLIWIIQRKRKKPIQIPSPEDAPPAPSKYSYSGKLNIYISRTPSGYDIPPLAYNLFRLSPGRVISFGEILEECNVEETFEGAGKLFFKAGANRTLILTNSSDCTIMKNREILMKNRSYQLSMDSKLDITFEDEFSEITFHYKDLKPSEMRVS